MAKILIVEDDQSLSQRVRDWLKADNHRVESADNGERALELLSLGSFDLLILDWNMPKLNGLELTRRFRAFGGDTPIIFLTGRTSISEKEAGFRAGADDYLTKPFDLRELSMRVEAILRRPKCVAIEQLIVGELTLERTSGEVRKNGEVIHLQKMEHALLEFLMNNTDKIFSSEALLNKIWPSDSSRTSHSLRVCINRLRNKIDSPDGGSYIENLHGRGYIMRSPQRKV